MSRGCFGVLRGDLPSATRSFRLIPGQEHANDCITASILIDTFYGFRPIHPRGPGDGWPGPLTPLFPAPYGRGKLLNVTFQPYVPGQKDVMTESLTAVAAQGIARIVPRKTRVGLVAGRFRAGPWWSIPATKSAASWRSSPATVLR